jgi:hypothetical protein
MVASEETEVFNSEGFEELTNEPLPPEVPSVLSSLLVVEETARILEDIKRKIQLQKEEERQKLEQQKNRSDSPNYFSLSRPIQVPSENSNDEGIFSVNTTKSFIILNNRYSDSSITVPKTISPLNNSSIPQSLSPDSGTDYEPFSASSSISPPFLSTTKRADNGSTSDVMKLSHNSDDEIFKPLSSFISPIPSTAPPKLFAISPTTSLSSIYPVRRLSGITMSHATTTTLAKSTPSISTDLINESQHKTAPSSSSDYQRPLSFQVLQTNFNFDTKSIDTYQNITHASLEPAIANNRYKSLANLPSANPSIPAPSWTPAVISTTSTTSVLSSQFTSLLTNNNRLTFGDPLAIKPIVSALEYPTFKLPSYSLSSDLKTPPGNLTSPNKIFEYATKSFDEALMRPTTLEKYNKFVEDQKLQMELNQQQKADFLSLSLSPPMNRRHKDIAGMKSSTLSL